MGGKDLEILDTAFQRLLSRNESYGPFEPQTTSFASSLPASGPALGKSSNFTIEFSRGLSSASSLGPSGLMSQKTWGATDAPVASHCTAPHIARRNPTARRASSNSTAF